MKRAACYHSRAKSRRAPRALAALALLLAGPPPPTGALVVGINTYAPPE